MNNKLRIAFVITALETGGAELMLCKLLRGLVAKQFEPHVVSLVGDGALKKPIEELGVPVHDVGMRRGIGSPSDVLRLRRIMRDINADIAQGWMYHGNLAVLFSAGASGHQVPVVWNIRQSLYDLKKERRLTAAVIWLGAKLSKRPAAILYNSRVSAEQHERLDYARQHRRVIPNGFDCDAFRPDADARARVRAELGMPDDSIVIGLVARYHPMKDHRSFVNAAGILHRKIPDAHFVLAGKGVDARNQELIAQISTLRLDRSTHLLGERTDIAALTAALDIATLSSAWGEGFPNVVGEAMACGLPCVVTDIGDSAWIVGETGRVVPPRDPEALANGWYELAEIGEGGRRQLGSAARRRIEDNFSLDAIVGQYEALYYELIPKVPT